MFTKAYPAKIPYTPYPRPVYPRGRNWSRRQPATYKPFKLKLSPMSGFGDTTTDVILGAGLATAVGAALYENSNAAAAEGARQEAMGQAIAAQAQQAQDAGQQQQLLGQAIAANAQAQFLKAQVADLTAKAQAAEAAGQNAAASGASPSTIEAIAKEAASIAGSTIGVPLNAAWAAIKSNPYFLYGGMGVVLLGALALIMRRPARAA